MDDFCISEVAEDDMDNFFINIKINPEKVSDVYLAIQANEQSGLWAVVDGNLEELVEPLKDVDELIKDMDLSDEENIIMVHNYCAKRLRAIVAAINPRLNTVRMNKSANN